jgi:hypothetical protein
MERMYADKAARFGRNGRVERPKPRRHAERAKPRRDNA